MAGCHGSMKRQDVWIHGMPGCHGSVERRGYGMPVCHGFLDWQDALSMECQGIMVL
jgi:hypothetical protein